MNRIWFEVALGLVFIIMGTLFSSSELAEKSNLSEKTELSEKTGINSDLSYTYGMTTAISRVFANITSESNALAFKNNSVASSEKTAVQDVIDSKNISNNEIKKICEKFLDSTGHLKDSEIQKELDKNRPLLACKDDFSKGLLFYLVENKKYKLAKELIEKKWIDIDELNSNNENILFYIFEEAPIEFINYILKSSKKLDLISTDSENTIITVLVSTNRKELAYVLQWILDQDSTLAKKKNKLGDTALSIATENQNKEFIKILKNVKVP